MMILLSVNCDCGQVEHLSSKRLKGFLSPIEGKKFRFHVGMAINQFECACSGIQSQFKVEDLSERKSEFMRKRYLYQLVSNDAKKIQIYETLHEYVSSSHSKLLLFKPTERSFQGQRNFLSINHLELVEEKLNRHCLQIFGRCFEDNLKTIEYLEGANHSKMEFAYNRIDQNGKPKLTVMNLD
jgi:hypothetical protein